MKGGSRQQDNCSHVSLEQKLQRLKENVFPLMTESNNEKECLFKITLYLRSFINNVLNVLIVMVIHHILKNKTRGTFFHELLVEYKLIQISNKFRVSVPTTTMREAWLTDFMFDCFLKI